MGRGKQGELCQPLLDMAGGGVVLADREEAGEMGIDELPGHARILAWSLWLPDTRYIFMLHSQPEFWGRSIFYISTACNETNAVDKVIYKMGFSIVFIKIMLKQMVLLFRKRQVLYYTYKRVPLFLSQATPLSVRILGSRWYHYTFHWVQRLNPEPAWSGLVSLVLRQKQASNKQMDKHSW